MKLTSFTDYALRVLIYLALEPEKRVTIQDVAKAYDISENHLMKVVHHLSRSGVIESLRGKGGGIRLALPVEQISIGRVIRSAEGRAAMVECLSDSPTCCIVKNCKLAGILVDAFDALYEKLDQYTLADLIEQPQPLIRILHVVE